MFLELTEKSRFTSLNSTEIIESKSQKILKEFDKMTLEDSIKILKRLNTLIAEKSLIAVKS